LRNHERLHTGERKYACPLCPKTFAHSNILKKHSYFHSGERPVHCEVCDKGFYQKCALDIHMNVHKRQWIAQGMQGVTLMDLNRTKKKPPPGNLAYTPSPPEFMSQSVSSVSSTMVEQSPVNTYNYM
jgi:Zinc-finger of C2H2 type